MSRPDELTMLRAQVQILREAHEVANGALRSAMAVAEREGSGTNWSGFREALRYSLEVSHSVLNALADGDKQAKEAGLAEAVATELLAHGEFGATRASSERNAREAAKAVIAILDILATLRRTPLQAKDDGR